MSLSLEVKVASLVVHYQEALSKKGHEFDHAAIATLENDPEVVAWFAKMKPFLPVKR